MTPLPMLCPQCRRTIPECICPPRPAPMRIFAEEPAPFPLALSDADLAAAEDIGLKAVGAITETSGLLWHPANVILPLAAEVRRLRAEQQKLVHLIGEASDLLSRLEQERAQFSQTLAATSTALWHSFHREGHPHEPETCDGCRVVQTCLDAHEHGVRRAESILKGDA